MTRVDQALVERGLCESREKAQRLILAGKARLNGRVVAKASERAREGDQLELEAPERYVSRGGHKLEHGLRHFGIDPAGLEALDVGASTGGFTDCLLQHGAARVHAIDVGSGQLAWKLRRDPRVVTREKCNARDLAPGMLEFERPARLAVVDCSFIGLAKILPAVVALLAAPAKVVALVKPQFEAGRMEVDKGAGVITDPAIHQRVLAEVRAFVESQPGLAWVGSTESPLVGPAGNKEYLALIEKHS